MKCVSFVEVYSTKISHRLLNFFNKNSGKIDAYWKKLFIALNPKNHRVDDNFYLEFIYLGLLCFYTSLFRLLL